MEVTDRIASLEQRVQLQEDDIQLLKSALADVVRRLNITEEQQAMQNKKGPTKGVNLGMARGTRKEIVSPASKRSVSLLNACKLKKSALSTIKRTNSTERVSPGGRRESYGDSKGGRNRAGSTSSSSSGKKNSESKPKEPMFSAGKRRVTHCKVTLLLSLAPKLPGLDENKAGSLDLPMKQQATTGSESRKASSAIRKKPPLALPVAASQTIMSFPRSPSFLSPMKSPSVMGAKGQRRSPSLYRKYSSLPMFKSHNRPMTELQIFLDPRLVIPEAPSYGYRGRDCRSNLYLLPTGETVYFIASVVVLYNVEEQLQRHYTGHNDDVKCLAVHPDRITIATGQVAGTSKDGKQLLPHVRVWDSVTLNTLHIIGMGFFDRAVTCIAFSKSNGGSNLCSVDDSNDHVLSVWDWQREEKLADVKCSNEAVFAADFHPTDTNIIVTCGKSHLYFWTLEGNCLIKKQGLFEKQEKPKFVLCVTFSENGDTITGDSSGNILVWGKGTNRISSAVQGAHEGGIFALCMLRDGTLVSGGGKDRKLVSWNGNYQKLHKTEIPEQFGPIRTIAEGKGEVVLIGTTRNFVLQGSLSGDFSPITQGHTDELWGLAAHPSKPQFFTCGQDKHITLWDAVSHSPIWTKIIEIIIDAYFYVDFSSISAK
uniref:Echinoderm microtubule-associated protein-like 1 n=1 Tax=Sphaerodactylus townsendi TaxID=933632 RepID=A0ACB8G622_9SAUR